MLEEISTDAYLRENFVPFGELSEKWQTFILKDLARDEKVQKMAVDATAKLHLSGDQTNTSALLQQLEESFDPSSTKLQHDGQCMMETLSFVHAYEDFGDPFAPGYHRPRSPEVKSIPSPWGPMESACYKEKAQIVWTKYQGFGKLQRSVLMFCCKVPSVSGIGNVETSVSK